VSAAAFAALTAIVLALAIPLAMDDGTASVDIQLRPLAAQAVDLARISCTDSPFERMVTLKVRVESITPIPTCPRSLSEPGGGSNAVVSQRTFFGATLRTDVVRCASVTCFASVP
jgi:hypothetical protein